jgi:hypothetical protein
MWNLVLVGLVTVLVLVHLETVLILMQYRCIVCTKHTTGPEIVLDAPNGTAR